MTNRDARSERILVVDDDEHALSGWLEVLGSAGYSAVGAGSFEDGRRLLDVHRPSLLITDVRLGAFNGLQLAIRASREPEPVPTIVVTGFADEMIRSEAERLDAIYMEKPVDADELLSAVNTALTREPESGSR